MLPIFIKTLYRPNLSLINKALDRFSTNSLSIEDILSEDDLVMDLKSPLLTQITKWYYN